MSQLPEEAARDWIDGFASALKKQDREAIGAHFASDGHWRDALGFGWGIETVSGREPIARILGEKLVSFELRSFELAAKRHAPRNVRRVGRDVLEAFVDFETSVGLGTGVVRLVPDPSAPERLKAWILLTTLIEIHGHGEKIGANCGSDVVFSRDFGGENWLDKRRKAIKYSDREPQVLVVGAGQAGLSIAARLGALSIDTLIIDRNEEVGDNWRKRYHSLALHNEIYGNHLPYMPFPPTFPTFVPKDKLAAWFKAYAESMDLNIWMGTSLSGGSYDNDKQRWNVEVADQDGQLRLLHPKHLVFATGVSGIPVRPKLPGLSDFQGTILHSGDYEAGREWVGKKTAVLGTGNSGHDVAQDLHASGANVSMIQRSSSTILSLKEAQQLYSLYTEGLSLEDADILAMALPHPILIESYKMMTSRMREADKPLLDGLEARGFKLDFGEDGAGFQLKYLNKGGGYYFNVGCSDLIVNGDVGLIQYSDIERFVENGILMKDGSVAELDLLVTATGFKNQQDVVRAYLGDEMADRIGPVWGFGDQTELRNMWCKTPQKGLWFTAGSFTQCRVYSKYLALQIVAEESGIA